MEPQRKRVVAISDLHCGHLVGLTPPEYQYKPHIKDLQKKLFDFYAETLARLQPIDILFVTGDAIDGKGHRGAGVEIFEPCLKTQAEMAARCIKEAKAKQIFMAHGTPYHVTDADGTDWEDYTASLVGAKCGSHLWVDVNGKVFDLKHHLGGSSIPHGRSTAIKRENLWNLLWAEKGVNPRSDVILRGHVHYFDYSGNSNWLGIVMPALQGPGSKYGVRRCNGIVDFGLVWFDVETDGRMQWNWEVLEVAERVEAVKA